MATRNGVDITESKVEVRKNASGSYDVVSVVTTLEYVGASKAFAEFLAKELDENGTIYPVRKGE